MVLSEVRNRSYKFAWWLSPGNWLHMTGLRINFLILSWSVLPTCNFENIDSRKIPPGFETFRHINKTLRRDISDSGSGVWEIWDLLNKNFAQGSIFFWRQPVCRRLTDFKTLQSAVSDLFCGVLIMGIVFRCSPITSGNDFWKLFLASTKLKQR